MNSNSAYKNLQILAEKKYSPNHGSKNERKSLPEYGLFPIYAVNNIDKLLSRLDKLNSMLQKVLANFIKNYILLG